jgi:hypothetical protein
MNAAQFQYISRRSETIVKLQMDEILRFWTRNCLQEYPIFMGMASDDRREIILRGETAETERRQKCSRISNVLWVTSPTHLPRSSTIESCKVRLPRIYITRKLLDKEY